MSVYLPTITRFQFKEEWWRKTKDVFQWWRNDCNFSSFSILPKMQILALFACMFRSSLSSVQNHEFYLLTSEGFHFLFFFLFFYVSFHVDCYYLIIFV